MIRVAVCDDEIYILKELSQHIEIAFQKLELPISLHSFDRPEELLRQWETEPFDVLFLDIDMPGMDGVILGRHLRAREPRPCIIYISNRENRVYDTFSVSPLRFIRKSHFHEEIDESVNAIFQWWESQKQKKLLIVSRDKTISLDIDSIIYVESLEKMQKIVTTNGTYQVRHPLGELEEKLSGFGFIRPHKGYLVNYSYISHIETGLFVLRDDIRIPISKRRITETKRAYMRLTTQALRLDAFTCQSQ